MPEVEGVIKRAIPELTIDSIENLGEGDFCRAFLVNQNLVFRFAKHEAARQSLRRENCLLPKIADELTLAVPKPLFGSFDRNAEESFAAYAYLPDTALTRGEYLKQDGAARADCAARVAGFLSEFHAVDLALAEKCGVPRADFAAGYTELLNRLTGKFSARPAAVCVEFFVGEIENYLAEAKTESFPTVLLHGDLSPDHVLFDGRQVTSIIDFGDLSIGDAAWDFVWIFDDYGTDFFRRAVSKYEVDNKERLIERVARFARLEAVQWILESLETGEKDLSEAEEHLRSLHENGREISLFFDDPPEN